MKLNRKWWRAKAKSMQCGMGEAAALSLEQNRAAPMKIRKKWRMKQMAMLKCNWRRKDAEVGNEKKQIASLNREDVAAEITEEGEVKKTVSTVFQNQKHKC